MGSARERLCAGPVHPVSANKFILGDLRDPNVGRTVVEGIQEVYQLAAGMGGAGYIFTGEHDADVKVTMRRSYGFRTFRILELALYQSLGKLPEPELTHEFF